MNRVATVHVVDDQIEMRHALRDFLAAAGLAVETYASAEEFLARRPPDAPGCLILDIRMPGMSGIELQARLVECGSEMPILIVSGYALVSDAVRAMRQGAFEFIEKPYSPAYMLERVHAAFEADRRRRAERSAMTEAQAKYESLTPREREILSHVIAGHPSKEIAALIGVAVSTIDNHRANLMRKLGAKNAIELAQIVWTVAPTIAGLPRR